MAQRTGIGHNKIGSVGNNLNQAEDSGLQQSELIQAFEAQKVVNRQLESELTAITEANNMKICDLTQEIDELKVERNKYQELLNSGIQDADESIEHFSRSDDSSISTIQEQKLQNVNYLLHEINSISNSYAGVLVRE